MSSFKSCFKKKLPYSLLIYPCVPCVSDGNNLYLFVASALCLLAFFIIRIMYRHNIKIVDYLNNDTWVPVYFVVSYALIMSIVMAVMIITRQRKKRFKGWLSVGMSSLGVGIVLLISGIASLKVYDAIYYLPIIGQIVAYVLTWVESYFGSNVPKIIVSWWGVALSWLFVFIPLVGPYVSSIATLIPQNLLLLWIGYLWVCSTSTTF